MGGLLNYPLAFKGDAYDVDEITEPGYYSVNATGGPMTKNSPFKLGTILVLNGKISSAGGGSPVVKIGIPNTGIELYIRTKWVSTWYVWRKIALAAVE